MPTEFKGNVGVSFSDSRASEEAWEIVNTACEIKLPKKWSNIPLWKEEVNKEIARILAQEGADAFEESVQSSKNGPGRKQMLKHVRRAGGVMEVQLTAESALELRCRIGKKDGFIEIDRFGRECLVKVFGIGSKGLLEIGMSWYGIAGPLIEDYRFKYQTDIDKLQQQIRETSSYAELDPELREKIDVMMRRITIWNDGRRIMEMILGQFGVQSRNPIRIPSEAFRVLLWPEHSKEKKWPQNWKQRVEGALVGLTSMSMSYKTYRSESFYGYGNFLGSWEYTPLGEGDHGDGYYSLNIMPPFIGCLRAFQIGEEMQLSSGRAVIYYDFHKKLKKEQKLEMGWKKNKKGAAVEKKVERFMHFNSGRPFFNSAAQLSPRQEDLVHWLEKNITLNKDGSTCAKTGTEKDSQDTLPNNPRRYGKSFCPLLTSHEKKYIAALGHFQNNPESGISLLGAKANTNGSPSGLAYQIGYPFPEEKEEDERKKIISSTLKDLHTVVIDYLEGVVAGKISDASGQEHWIAFEHFVRLERATLSHKLLLFCFLPVNYNEIRKRKWEEITDRQVIEDPDLAEEYFLEQVEAQFATKILDKSATASKGKPKASNAEKSEALQLSLLELEPLLEKKEEVDCAIRIRLYEAMKKRKLKQKDLAKAFNVSEMMVGYWLKGIKHNEKNRIQGKPISAERIPQILQWIEHGTIDECKKM